MGKLDMPKLIERSLMSMGDTVRLQHALARARRGEDVTVAVIGGSITGGAKASAAAKRYGNRIAQWWRDAYPEVKVKFVNAGIGGTGSNYGCLRARRDLLAHEPDFVVVEFGVNDSSAQAKCRPTIEGLVRQILNMPNHPALVMLFMMNTKPANAPNLADMAMDRDPVVDGGRVRGLNVQTWHREVGEHYGLPMVSFRDALWPEIKSGRIEWEDVIADMVHPNDLGHDYSAAFVAAVLERVRADLPADDALPAVPAVSSPLFTDRFERVAYFPAERIEPVATKGWTLEQGNWRGQWWAGHQPGDWIEFDVEGTGVAAVLCVADRHAGAARLRVDNGPWVKRKGWHGQQWKDLVVPFDLAHGLESGRHRVRIEITAEKDPNGDSHEFRIHGIAATGVAPAR